MSILNWKVFELKYDKREQWAFEQMSYLLFCVEMDCRIGLFRYKNQTGLETEPIVKDGITYGFQAKYYTTSISQNKDDIIDSIHKAKNKNPQLNIISLYTNQELSESSDSKKKKPQYQIDIETEAKKVGVDIEWRVPSHFEFQLALPENKYIYDLFFNLKPNGGDLIDDVYKHNNNILRTIQTEIIFNGKEIKINRNNIITQISRTSDNSQNIIISGEGGCGKTAVLKEFYNQNFQKIPVCIFKATELNVNNINDLFRFYHNFSFSQFLETYQSETKKIFVIDSAEKLAELINNDILNSLIFTLKDNDWTIFFTTRYSYLNDLNFYIKENYQLFCETIDIPILAGEEIKNISESYNFTLPENQKFTERLQNLFYLNEYIRSLPNIDKKDKFRDFTNLIWKKRIQNFNIKKDNIHIERERCVIEIARERCNSGKFYINIANLPQSALSKLQQDEILGYDETHNGHFITHDIYEEWALEKIISRCYANYTNSKQFFNELEDSLPIRRAFRLWLSEQLSEDVENVKEFIDDTFTKNEIPQHWKDELIVSVLLSDYSEIFFVQFEKEIITDGFKILKRILFLLRIACTEISTITDFDFIKSKGRGWEVVIAFIYKHRVNFFENNLNLICPILTDWCNNIKKRETTRLAGLLALSMIEKTETTENFFFHGNSDEKILAIVFNATSEIKTELKIIFDKVTINKWVNHKDPYEGLCSKILEKPYLALEVIKVLPISVIQLCNLFWKKRKRDDDYSFDRNDMEDKYGVASEFHYDYFPASALQTPIYWLLQNAFKETLYFIIDFTNRCVENYRNSDYGKEDVKEITLHIENKEIKQYLCWAFWGMYRGVGSPVVPDLLQSIHMALEKMLLQISDSWDKDNTENLLKYILANSKSASLTAVITSIVLVNPNKFYNIALILFQTIELFHLDTIRQTNEFQAKSLYGIGYGLNQDKRAYADERLKTCEDEHRKSSLESLFLNYQFLGVQGFTGEQNTEFIKKLQTIIDLHKENILTKPEYERNTLGILLARMDRRNLTAKVTKQDDNGFIVKFSPTNLSDELIKQSEQATRQVEDTFKYSLLRTWADFIFDKKCQNTNQKYEQYENNPLLVLSEIKQLIEELNAGQRTMGIFDYSIPAFACAKLMIEHKDKLSKEDKDFCKEIILSFAYKLLSDDYNYQVSDGVEASVHAIPHLILEYSEMKEDLLLPFILILFNDRPVGNKRVCDYVIESIREAQMWENLPNDTQAILFGFIKWKPIYNQILIDKRKALGNFSLNNLSFDIQDIISLEINDLEIIYQLIPSNTKNDIHLKIYEKSLPAILPKLLIDRRSYIENEEMFGNNSNIYSLRLHIFRRIAHFILERNINEIDNYLQPFINSFDAIEETASFLDEIISAQDYHNKYEQFWHIWNKLYSKFVEICATSQNFHLDKVIHSYLLAGQWWREGITEWHSLKKENLSLYADAAKDLGHNPNVLYSISKILNSIGSKFLDIGINWIYTIVSKNKSLELKDLEFITLYYSEKLMRRFIFNNKAKIKQDIRLKNKIIPILEFLIERGSVRGYLLRESIL